MNGRYMDSMSANAVAVISGHNWASRKGTRWREMTRYQLVAVPRHAMTREGLDRHHMNGARIMTVLCALALALVLAGMAMWSNGSVAVNSTVNSSAGSAGATTTYIVRPGDTLWGYASQVTPRGGDIRQTVSELIELNDLETASLTAGQSIVVPVR